MAGKKAKKINPAIAYLRNIGGGLSVLGLIGIVPFPQFYWYGVGALCLGLAALALEALLEDWRIQYRVLVSGFWVAVAILFIAKLVCVSAPLEIAAMANIGDYANGADVYGIKWEAGLSELRIVLSNPTPYDYDDVDIYFNPDVPTRKVTQISHVPDASLTVINPGSLLKEGDTAELYASSMGFRMRFPKIPEDTIVEVLAALVMPAAQPLGKAEKGRETTAFIGLIGDVNNFAGPKKVATTLHAKGQYRVLNRTHHIEYTYGLSH